MDEELMAMSKCHEQLGPLDINTKSRVIQWLISKYDLGTQIPFVNGSSQNRNQHQSNDVRILPSITNEPEYDNTLIAVPQPKAQSENSIESFETVADLFSAASPKFEWEKALVVAAFLQVKLGMSDFNGFAVNKELKHLGHGTKDITGVIKPCIDKKPQLIIQTRKEGKTQQAQKKYKVSAEGLKVVKSMINAS